MVSKDKLAVTVNGNDICRIIPLNYKDGSLDLKISFLNNKYYIETRSLFSARSVLFLESEGEITYHNKNERAPVKIHVKKTEKDSQQYITLPLKRIQVPNTKQIYPIPLMRIEIPDLHGLDKYVPKNNQKALNINNANVIELFMYNARSEQGFGASAKNLSTVTATMLLLPFEFYASNNIIQKNEKYAYYFYNGQARECLTAINLVDDIGICAMYYYNPNISNKSDRIIATFEENELAEDFLLMLGIIFPVDDNVGIGAHFSKVRQLYDEELSRHDYDSNFNSILYHRGLAARYKVSKEIAAYRTSIEKLRDEVFLKVKIFSEAFREIRQLVVDRLESILSERNGKESWADWITTYFFIDPGSHSNDLHVLLARYLDFSACLMHDVCIKHSTNLESEDKQETRFYSQECFDNAIDIERHTWLLYNDKLDIDICHDSLGKFIGEETESVIVVKAEEHPTLSYTYNKFKKMDELGYLITPVGTICFDEEDFKDMFLNNDGVLEDIYKIILNYIKTKNIGNTKWGKEFLNINCERTESCIYPIIEMKNDR